MKQQHRDFTQIEGDDREEDAKQVHFFVSIDRALGVPRRKSCPPKTQHDARRTTVVLFKASLEIQVDIQARKLYLEFFIWFWGRGERYLRMETGVLHRISIQIL